MRKQKRPKIDDTTPQKKKRRQQGGHDDEMITYISCNYYVSIQQYVNAQNT